MVSARMYSICSRKGHGNPGIMVDEISSSDALPFAPIHSKFHGTRYSSMCIDYRLVSPKVR